VSGQSATRAPLYTDTIALCAWLLERFRDDDDLLSVSIRKRSLRLLGAVTLALKGRRRDDNLELADELLIVLRAELRLAGETGLLTDSQLLHALALTDSMGRQIGGWLRSLGPV